MKSEYKDSLKIQLRAESFGSYSHALEYRIDPNQDITYEEEPTGFIKKLLKKLGHKFIKTFDTSWHQPRVFSSPITMELHEFYDSFNWGPMWCDSKETLEKFKKQFKTYGDLRQYIEQHTEKRYKEWEAKREKYLKSRETIY